MYTYQIKCVAQLCLAIFLFVVNAQSASDTKSTQDAHLIESELYAQNNYIVTLNSTNWKNIIYQSKYAWVVEFHDNKCLDCRRFSLIYKIFSESINNWKDVVRVAAYNCDTDESLPFCQVQKVVNIPTLFYFSPYTAFNESGYKLARTEIAEILRENIIEMLKFDQKRGINISSPNLAGFRSLKHNNVFNGLSNSIQYYFIIFEEPNSYLGLTGILDFINVPQILIHRVSSHDNLINKFTIGTFPSLIAIDRENIISNLMLAIPSRTAVYNRITNFLKLKGLIINTPDVMDDSIILQHYLPKSNTNLTAVQPEKDNLYQADLESTLQYSLTAEISAVDEITDKKMKALINYLKVLVKYFPTESASSQYLRNIYNAVKSKMPLQGKEFYSLITSLNKNLSNPNGTQWMGCMGTLPYTRRAPCGSWILFHTLSVRYAIAVDKNHWAKHHGGDVILALYEYAEQFMRCIYCTEYYLYMAKKHNIHNIKTADEAVIWLWKIHNELNLRLVGDVSEDPKFPKMQYPVRGHCPKCRNADNTWNEQEVLKYLKKKYGAPIKYDLTR